jgi:hypothetical protein
MLTKLGIGIKKPNTVISIPASQPLPEKKTPDGIAFFRHRIYSGIVSCFSSFHYRTDQMLEGLAFWHCKNHFPVPLKSQ